MLEKVEATLVQIKLLQRYFNLDYIGGLHFIRMQRGVLLDVIDNLGNISQ